MKVIENVTIRQRAYNFLLMFYSNYGSVLCRFWDIKGRLHQDHLNRHLVKCHLN